MARQTNHPSPDTPSLVVLPAELNAWQSEPVRPSQSVPRESISRCFRFSNFRQAFAFMTQVAMLAEKANHHPNWQNVYNEVIVTLTTHSEDAVTEKDFDLARKIDKVYEVYTG